MTIDWDDEFSNAAYIVDGALYPSIWKDRADEFAHAHEKADFDRPYGPHPRQKFDLFGPHSSPRGLVCFVHGGFWIEFDKSYWSHLARGLCNLGWSVAVPSYVLAPQVRISEITQMIAQAIQCCANLVDGPIVLVGHSAGGHLVTRMVCSDSPLERSSRDRVTTVVTISGIHDLRNLLKTQMNEQLQLDKSEAFSESPALLEPSTSADVVCWVGSLERPEFIHQSKLLRKAWEAHIPGIQLEIENGRHHFDVIESMENPASPLVRMIDGTD